MRIQITDKPTIKIDTDRTLTAIEHIQSSSLLMPTNSGHLIQGDNAEIMRCLLKQGVKIDLIYIDPPYLTNLDFKTKEGKFAYSDKFSLDTYLTMLYERLILMKQLLSEKGSIYVHVDYRTSAYVRLMMDEIFGAENFRNEIIWCYRGMPSRVKKFANKHDCLIYYSKSKNLIFNIQYGEATEGSLRTFESGRRRGYNVNLSKKMATVFDWDKYHEAVRQGVLPNDLTPVSFSGGQPPLNDWWDDIKIIGGPDNLERTGYPTQKPEALLERIIKASSNEGDLVADFFCGSGTTAAAAHKLNRNWIGVDMGDEAIKTTKERMLNLDSNFTLSNLNK